MKVDFNGGGEIDKVAFLFDAIFVVYQSNFI